jgi:hypothetical protein
MAASITVRRSFFISLPRIKVVLLDLQCLSSEITNLKRIIVLPFLSAGLSRVFAELRNLVLELAEYLVQGRIVGVLLAHLRALPRKLTAYLL